MILVLAEGIIFTQLPILGIVPSFSVVGLLLLKDVLDTSQLTFVALLSGLLLDLLRPDYSPWFSVYFLAVAVGIFVVKQFDFKLSYSFLTAALFLQYILFTALNINEISLIAATYGFVANLVICSLCLLFVSGFSRRGGGIL